MLFLHVPIERFEVKVDLAEVFRFEASDFQLYGNKAGQAAMVEKQIDEEIASADLNSVLFAKEGEILAEQSRPRLIDRLTSEFTRDQLRNLMNELKVSSPDRVLISQWKANRWIEEIDKFKYRKLL